MWSFYLGRFWNIHVRIHFSFILILILIGLTQSISNGIVAGILSCFFIVVAFVFVFFHEMAHSLVAKHYGIHVEHIMLWPLGGIANMERLPEEPMLEIKVSAAGPLINLAFALVLSPIAVVTHIMSQSPEPGVWKEIAGFFLWVLKINLILLIFNLIPAFPLDGGRIYRAWKALREGYLDATQKTTQLANTIAIILGCIGIVFLEMGLILLGIFIYIASKEEMRMIESQYYSNTAREPMYFFYYDPGRGHIHYHFSAKEFHRDFANLQKFLRDFFYRYK